MNCGMECVKYLLFIFNFVFALGGLAILVIGILISVKTADIDAVTDIPISVPTAVLIAVGAIIFIVAFFGCCGAIRESHCMVVTFAVLLLTLLVVQIAVGAYAFLQLDTKTEEKIDLQLKKFVNNYFDDKPNKDAVDTLQTIVQCCGYNDYRDYLSNPRNPNGQIPFSCCNHAENVSCSVKDAQSRAGCREALYPFLKNSAYTLGGLAIGIAAIEFIGVIFSFCLANSIRNVERRGYKV